MKMITLDEVYGAWVIWKQTIRIPFGQYCDYLKRLNYIIY